MNSTVRFFIICLTCTFVCGVSLIHAQDYEAPAPMGFADEAVGYGSETTAEGNVLGEQALPATPSQTVEPQFAEEIPPAVVEQSPVGQTEAGSVSVGAGQFDIERSSPNASTEVADQKPKQPEQVKSAADSGKKGWLRRLFGGKKKPAEDKTEPAEVAVEAEADALPVVKYTTPEGRLAQEEEVRRQAAEVEALQLFNQAEQAMRQNEFEEATRLFNSVLEKMPKRPHTVEKRAQCRQSQAECAYRIALNYYRDKNIPEAQKALRNALGYDPSHAGAARVMKRIREDELKREEESTRPVHVRKTAEYQAKTTDINAALEKGNQFMAVNDLAKAEEEYRKVLLLDPLNSEAAAQLKRVADRRYRKESEQMDRFQADMIAQVRDTWTPSLKRAVTRSTEPGVADAAARPGSRRLLEKLNRIMIPQLDFRQANIHDVISYIDQQAQAADTESPPNERGVNIVLHLRRPGASAAPSSYETDPFALPTDRSISTSPDVPTVTLALRNVYLLDAIKFITEMTGLKYRIENDVVVITPADVVVGEVVTQTYKVQPGVISEHILAASTASTGGGGLFDLAPPAPSTSGGSGDIKQFFVEAGVPFPEGTSITHRPSLNLLIVSNTRENLEKFEHILSMLNVVPIQVEIEARFVEVEQTDLEELGFEWLLKDDWVVAQKTSQAGMPMSARERIQVNQSDMTKGLRFMSGSGDTLVPEAGGTLGNILSISGVLTTPQLSLILHALEQRSGSNLLSAPKVTTRTGANAEIKVVRELIYPTDWRVVEGERGTDTRPGTPGYVTPESFEMREIGVILNVTPTVGPDNYTIDLVMLPQVTELHEWLNYGTLIPDYQGGFNMQNIPQPVFHNRAIVTSISIWDGQTVVMGGLITEAQEKTEDKVPFLGDIPVLGRFFRNKTDQSVKRNLLIFVTANLVDPAGNKINKDSGTTSVSGAGSLATGVGVP